MCHLVFNRYSIWKYLATNTNDVSIFTMFEARTCSRFVHRGSCFASPIKESSKMFWSKESALVSLWISIEAMFPVVLVPLFCLTLGIIVGVSQSVQPASVLGWEATSYRDTFCAHFSFGIFSSDVALLCTLSIASPLVQVALVSLERCRASIMRVFLSRWRCSIHSIGDILQTLFAFSLSTDFSSIFDKSFEDALFSMWTGSLPGTRFVPAESSSSPIEWFFSVVCALKCLTFLPPIFGRSTLRCRLKPSRSCCAPADPSAFTCDQSKGAIMARYKGHVFNTNWRPKVNKLTSCTSALACVHQGFHTEIYLAISCDSTKRSKVCRSSSVNVWNNSQTHNASM